MYHRERKGVLGWPVISACGTSTEKVSEFLDHVFKPIMQQNRFYIKDSSDVIKKLKEIKEVLKDAMIVTADVIGCYLSIPHDVGLGAIKRILDDYVNKKSLY